MLKYYFKKKQRLSSKKDISEIYKNGSFFRANEMFSFAFLRSAAPQKCSRILIAISKRRIRKASHRNKIRRRIKEVYRTQIFHTFEDLKKKTSFLLVLDYTRSEGAKFGKISEKLLDAFENLQNHIEIHQ